MVTVAECLGMDPYQSVGDPGTPTASFHSFFPSHFMLRTAYRVIGIARSSANLPLISFLCSQMDFLLRWTLKWTIWCIWWMCTMHEPSEILILWFSTMWSRYWAATSFSGTPVFPQCGNWPGSSWIQGGIVTWFYALLIHVAWPISAAARVTYYYNIWLVSVRDYVTSSFSLKSATALVTLLPLGLSSKYPFFGK